MEAADWRWSRAPDPMNAVNTVNLVEKACASVVLCSLVNSKQCSELSLTSSATPFWEAIGTCGDA